MKTVEHSTSNQTNESGQGFVEYAIILILVGIAVVAIVSLMQPAVGEVFSRFVAQAPVAPPSLLNYTPPPTFTSTPTPDGSGPLPPTATNTSPPPAPSNTADPPTPSNTPVTPTATNTPSPTPCGFGPHNLAANGSIRVQMEDFRCGGAGVAFQEVNNDGGPGSVGYRTDVGAEGPDLQGVQNDPTGGNLNIGWVRDGEWLEYEIIAAEAAGVDFTIRNASLNTSNPRIRITVNNGILNDDTGIISLGSTNGWQDWANDVVSSVQLFAGSNIVRFSIISGSVNFNYFDIQPYSPTATPTPVTPTATPVPTDTPTSPPPVTLTLYSNANHDGYIREDGTSNTGDPNQTNNTSNSLFAGDYNGNDNEKYVSIVSFDTSAIPANATITSVRLRLQQRNGQDGTPFGDFGLGVLYADIAPAAGFSGSYTLQAADFIAGAAGTNVIVLSPTVNSDDWSTGTLGAGNFGLVNRNGFTQFRIHFQLDDDGDGERDRFRFDSADAGQNNQPPAPELIVVYSVP